MLNPDIEIDPPNPSLSDPVTILISWQGCIIDSGIERFGNTFDIHYNYQGLCVATPPGGIARFEVSQLDPGNYTVISRTLFDNVLTRQSSLSFKVIDNSVLPFSIPALDSAGLGIMILLLSLFAVSSFKTKYQGKR